MAYRARGETCEYCIEPYNFLSLDEDCIQTYKWFPEMTCPEGHDLYRYTDLIQYPWNTITSWYAVNTALLRFAGHHLTNC
jgi:hypothetical protein